MPCSQGLLQVCLQLVLLGTNDSYESHLESAALRLMAACLSGESDGLRNVLLKELNDSSREILVSSYRVVLERACEAVRDVFNSAKRGSFTQAVQTSGIYEAAEFMRVIKAVCAGNAQVIS
eukprot:SAG31_NODE_17051_length_685_cov_1.126280_2_plen_120_part_01